MSALPDTHPRRERILAIQDLAMKHEPPVPKKGFAFKEPLSHGWMLPYLLGLEGMIWGRWQHWYETKEAGKIIGPIPQIAWCGERTSLGRKEFERGLCAVTRNHDWAGWSSWKYVDYFLDWLLFGFGDPKQPTEPETPGSECEGASERLYQTFNLGPILAFPNDYLGDILAENNFGRRSGFYPTPMPIVEMMLEMSAADHEDMRDKTVCDPAVGTGRMILAASNYSYRLYGNDINQTVIKACLVNGYLYAPWLVKPFGFWESSPRPEAIQRQSFVNELPTTVKLLQAPAEEAAPQLELELI